MKTRKVKRLKKAFYRLRGVFAGNPVLVYGLGLPFVVFAGTSLKNAVALTIALAVTTIPSLTLASLLGKNRSRVPSGVRLAVYSLAAGLLLIPAVKLVSPLSPYIFDSLGIYFPLMAVNTILVYRAEEYSVGAPPHRALLDAVLHVLGFAIVICIVGALRELMGRGSVWGLPVEAVKIKMGGVLVPFSGFIITGFMCALYKALSRIIKAAAYRADNPKITG